MIINYEPYIIEVYNDDRYYPSSTDNVITYNKEYDFSEEYVAVNSVGIEVSHRGLISTAIIRESHGVPIGDNSVIVDQESIFICYGYSVYSLNIPALTLNWKTQVDMVTCFGIYSFEDDFIVHGELSICRLAKTGHVKWEFSAADIFVTQNGDKEGFKIVDGLITVVDWNGDEYVLNGEGKLMNADNDKQERPGSCRPPNSNNND